jgi:RNA recognition motif-containing protein
MSNKLYVGNLPFSKTEDDVRDLFAEFGVVKEVKLITDRETGHLRGFGFVTMDSDTAAKGAIQALDQSDFGGRTLTVNVAKEREGGGGDRRGGRDDRRSR